MAKKLMVLVGMLAVVLVAAVPALAQSDSPESQGVTQPCPIQLDRFPVGTVCGEGGAYIDPETQTAAQPVPTTGTGPGGGPSGPYGKFRCVDFADQGQAQEAYLQGVAGSNPAADPSVLDPNGDGFACENLPTATDPNAPAPGSTTGEQTAGEQTTGAGIITGEQTAGETTAAGGTTGERTRRERTGRGGTTGPNGEVTTPNGEVTGGAKGGGGGGGSANGSGNAQGGSPQQGSASQGGVSGAVGDAFSPITRGRLPNTGGGWTVLLLIAAVLIGGGWLLVRRFSPSSR